MNIRTLASAVLSALVAVAASARELSWSDEFDGPKLDERNWTRIPPPPHGYGSDWNHHMSLRDDLVEFRDGCMVLVGVANADTNADPRPFLTGGVFSPGKVALRYGLVEIRAKFENAQGAWPAFWMLPTSHVDDNGNKKSWPHGGEIDIVERLNGDDKVYQTCHSAWTYIKKRGDEPKQGGTAAITNGEFNVYGLERTPTALVWYVNGKETFRYEKLADGDPSQWPFDTDFYLLLDMQLGGRWVGKPVASDLPVRTWIDWVRIYRDDARDAFEKAGPVWPEGLEKEMNTLIGFRTSFEAKAADEVRLNLAAWYSYRVTLNGEFVAFGPARGSKGFFRPDDLKLPAKDGKNDLQVEVAGYNVPNFYLVEQPPFFKAAVAVNGKAVAVSDRDFRAFRLPRVQKVPRYTFQRTFAEVYDVPGRETGPLALAPAPEPKLIDRVVPYPDYELNPHLTPVSFADVAVDMSRKVHADRSLTLPDGKGWFKGFPMAELTLNSAYLAQRLAYANRRPATEADRAAKSFDLAAGKSAVFDNGFADTGFPGFTVTVRKPGRMTVTFDEVFTGDEVRGIDRYRDCCNILVWNFEKPGVYEVSSFEPYTMRCLDVGVLEGEMTVSAPRFRSYKNPSAKRATFRSSDPDLGRIFDAARETFRQNAVDVFTDCPSRERAGWNCDAFFTGAVSTLLTGGTGLERVFEENIALPKTFGDIPDGMIPMCYPSDHRDGVFIPNWAMWFVLETEEYLARSGDRRTVDRLRPRLEKLVEFLWKFRNADGLLEKLPSWVFVEWSRSNKLVQDVNYPSNMTWAGMLEAMARMYGRKDLAEEARRVRETIRRQSWTGEWFCDNAVRQKDGSLRLSGECTETCQYYAFFFGTATKELYPALWKTLLADFGPQRFSEDRKALRSHKDIWPSNAFIGNYLRLKLLEREGMGNRILAETKGYFKYMVDRSGTLWENDTTCASCNHGFASYAAVLLLRSVLGVEKVDLVNRTLTLRETEVDLDWCEAELPAGSGTIKFGWKRENGARKRTVSVPKGWKVL